MMRTKEICEVSNKKQKGSEDEQEDRLSNLPDSILLHILSFLPMKDAVKTVLLRRFGNLWTYLQTLNFDGRSYLNYQRSCHGKWFTVFVPQALLRHECPAIIKFSLKFGSYLYFSPTGFKPPKGKKALEPNLASTIDSWIHFALRKKVKILDLGILAHGSSSTRFDYDLPHAVFRSDFIIEMSLVNISLRQPEQVHLKALKNLSLTTIMLDDKMMEGILSGCPSLESLSLIQCYGLHKLNCTSARLTKLMIVVGNDFSWVEISGPNLMSLNISGLHGQVNLRNVSSVVEASLDICHDYCNIGSLLEGLHQASTFTITSWCILMLITSDKDSIPCPSSTRKHLVLKTQITKRHLPGIARLLQSSPQLETLTIQIGDGTSPFHPEDSLRVGISEFSRWDCWNDENWLNASEIGVEHFFETEIPFGCLKNHLRTVRISGASVSNSSLLHLVKFFLEKSLVLERMEISVRKLYPCSYTWHTELAELSKMLSTWRKASPSAMIVLA
ncbi:putative F-box protein At1g49610 [Apium graveolens]|uniref:putative F-box protein At1g49610 n=1 Tax=Apium graveolens TaxID=4045 RepID=UPI003D791723